ncbi:unnamed protein product [Microthlaspi erraticum]|uniref:Uncharacterized protein n=1 Tax=Microthlaspi erraticum TaxID=1685480 RepID=A0A6D2JL37_9BRAS|nr:unnamed protein product [Microthlaspi erraticum]
MESRDDGLHLMEPGGAEYCVVDGRFVHDNQLQELRNSADISGEPNCSATIGVFGGETGEGTGCGFNYATAFRSYSLIADMESSLSRRPPMIMLTCRFGGGGRSSWSSRFLFPCGASGFSASFLGRDCRPRFSCCPGFGGLGGKLFPWDLLPSIGGTSPRWYMRIRLLIRCLQFSVAWPVLPWNLQKALVSLSSPSEVMSCGIETAAACSCSDSSSAAANAARRDLFGSSFGAFWSIWDKEHGGTWHMDAAQLDTQRKKGEAILKTSSTVYSTNRSSSSTRPAKLQLDRAEKSTVKPEKCCFPLDFPLTLNLILLYLKAKSHEKTTKL